MGGWGRTFRNGRCKCIALLICSPSFNFLIHNSYIVIYYSLITKINTWKIPPRCWKNACKHSKHKITSWNLAFLTNLKGFIEQNLSHMKIFNLKRVVSNFRYFSVGGSPSQVIELLSQNYSASAQMANLMAEWLILAGATITDVQSMVENHLKEMILKTFDPKKADTIFTEEGEVSLKY